MLNSRRVIKLFHFQIVEINSSALHKKLKTSKAFATLSFLQMFLNNFRVLPVSKIIHFITLISELLMNLIEINYLQNLYRK